MQNAAEKREGRAARHYRDSYTSLSLVMKALLAADVVAEPPGDGLALQAAGPG